MNVDELIDALQTMKVHKQIKGYDEVYFCDDKRKYSLNAIMASDLQSEVYLKSIRKGTK